MSKGDARARVAVLIVIGVVIVIAVARTYIVDAMTRIIEYINARAHWFEV